MDLNYKNGNVPGYGWGIRHVQVILVFFWNLLCYTMCNVLPICIVAMTNPRDKSNPNIPVFPQWNNESIILCSFGWGYAVTLLFGGHYAKKHGIKWFFIGIMSIGVVCNLSLPSATIYFGSIGLIINYFIQGFSQGFGNTMLPQFINSWVPIEEKTTLGNFVLNTGPGSIFATLIAGSLCSSKWGWPSVFYLVGIIGLVWIVFMLILGENLPEEHKSITPEELLYITYKKDIQKKAPIPWNEVLTSKAVWALWVAHIGGGVLYWLAYIEFPTYVNRVFKLSVTLDSAILTVAYTISWLAGIVVSGFVDYLNNRKILKTGFLRKICNSVSIFGASLCIFWLSFLNDQHTYMAIYLIIILFLMLSTSSCGYKINYNDISPNFCGSLYGIGGFLSCMVIFGVVFVTQAVVIDQDDPKQWAVCLWFCCIIGMVSNIIFILYGSGEVQKWDTNNEYTDESKIPLLPSKF